MSRRAPPGLIVSVGYEGRDVDTLIGSRDYVHLPALGNPKENRADYRLGLPAARRRFRHCLATAAGQAALNEASELARAGVVALLCFEASHETCHRASVAEALRDHVPEVPTIRA